ncbi:MAG: flagellar basal body-associated FliL family protein [Gammaproteobacteria bacterium]
MANEKELAMDEQSKEPSSRGKAKWIILAVLAGILLVGGGTVAVFMLKGKSDPEAVDVEVPEQRAPAHYFTLKPFVSNYRVGNRQRYLQVEMTFVTRDERNLALFEEQMPMIRNDIVTFLSRQEFDELREPEGRDVLRQNLVETMQVRLEEETGETGLEDILFTAFVMQ